MSGFNKFLSYFSKLEDPRIEGLVLYPIDEMLLVTLCAVICRNHDWEEIAYWGEHHLQWLRQFLPFNHGIAATQTFARLFNAINSKKFASCFEAWVASFGNNLVGKQVTIDGKVIRGSKQSASGEGAIDIVSAYVHELGIVIAQEKVANQSNEITAIPELLQKLALEGSIVTIDAIGTQKEIVKQITAQKADYVIALKANQSDLYKDVKLFFEENSKEVLWDDYQDTDYGHGRIEIRDCTTSSDIGWLIERHPAWENLRSVTMVKSIRINKRSHEETSRTRYYISSISGKAREMLGYVRNHWAIENNLHWCLDISFREDSCRTRTDYGAENLAIIRKMAINLLKKSDSSKVSLKRKMLKGNWDLNYLQNVLLVSNL